MILAVLATTSNVETLLNNLSEADFDPNSVSVIMQDSNLRDKIASDAGPFKGVTAATLPASLAHAGLTKQAAQPVLAALKKGQAFVAMNPPAESVQAALDMFKDYAPPFLKVIPS